MIMSYVTLSLSCFPFFLTFSKYSALNAEEGLRLGSHTYLTLTYFPSIEIRPNEPTLQPVQSGIFHIRFGRFVPLTWPVGHC